MKGECKKNPTVGTVAMSEANHCAKSVRLKLYVFVPNAFPHNNKRFFGILRFFRLFVLLVYYLGLPNTIINRKISK